MEQAANTKQSTCPSWTGPEPDSKLDMMESANDSVCFLRHVVAPLRAVWMLDDKSFRMVWAHKLSKRWIKDNLFLFRMFVSGEEPCEMKGV